MGRALVRALNAQPAPRLLPFQRQYIGGAFASGVDVAALSAPRGAGKTMLLGRVAALAVTPGSPIFHAGEEVIVCAGSVEQARLLARAANAALPKDHLRWTGLTGASFRVGAVHPDTGTGIRVISSNPKKAMGLGARNRLLLADEPASWDERGGSLMIEALEYALGKLDASRLLLIGTRSPASLDNWWPRMIRRGTVPGRYVQLMAAGEDDPWDSYQTLARANPVVRVSASMRAKLLRERDEARTDEAKRHAYRLWRLNHHGPAGDDMLLTVGDWRRVVGRPVADKSGQCAVGIDLGATRSWSAAVAIWESGRMECWAVVGGIPSLQDRERQDGISRGVYTRLQEDGRLHVIEGRETGSVEYLVGILRAEGLRPGVVLADYFQAGRLRDACRGWAPVRARRTLWKEGGEDVASLRELVRDHGLSCEESSRRLLAVSLSQASVRYDDSGNAKVTKRRADASRDDVAIAATLASGAIMRRKRRPPRRSFRSVVV